MCMSACMRRKQFWNRGHAFILPFIAYPDEDQVHRGAHRPTD